MSRGRVTFVIASLTGGGAERKTVTTTAALARRGWAVSLVTMHSDVDHYDVDPQVERVETPPELSRQRSWLDLPGQRRRLRALRQVILDTKPDAVVGVIDASAIGAIAALRGTGIPVVAQEALNPRFQGSKPPWPLLRRLAYPAATRVVVLTEDVAEWAHRHRPRWQVTVVPPPIDVPTDVRPFAPGWYGPRNLVAMGRLVPVKGFDMLLAAMARIAPTHTDWHLTIFGEGPERSRLEALVTKLGLSDRVHLPGFVPSPFAAVAAADLFVCSSRHEPFGMAIAEAMSLGVPCVSFDAPSGPRSFIRPGIDGLLVPVGDVPALAHALATLMTDERARTAMSTAAPGVQDRHGVTAVIDRWDALLTDVGRRR